MNNVNLNTDIYVDVKLKRNRRLTAIDLGMEMLVSIQEVKSK